MDTIEKTLLEENMAEITLEMVKQTYIVAKKVYNLEKNVPIPKKKRKRYNGVNYG